MGIRRSKEEQWWFRLAKVIYITFFIFLIFIIPFVWSENITYEYVPVGLPTIEKEGTNSGFDFEQGQPVKKVYSYTDAFWYSLITLITYISILKLIKVAFLYITIGEKPNWKKELQKPFI